MELNFDELWIGDEVFVKSKGRNGRWEGPASGKRGRIRIGEKVFLVPYSGLEKARKELDTDTSRKPVMAKKKQHRAIAQEVPKEIDLHIEVLEPQLQFQLPELILNYQLKKCREFVDNAIRNKLASVTIIHGKGTGVLKSEVVHYLEGLSEVKFLIPKKDGGSTEVWLTGALY